LVQLAACDSESQTLRVYMPSQQSFDPESIQTIFAEKSEIVTVRASPVGSLSSLEALERNQADIVLLENSTAFVAGVRAIHPVYESVLHVLVREGFVAADPTQSLRDASILVADQSAAGHAIVELIARRQGLTPGDYRKLVAPEPGAADIIVYFGPIDADHTQWYQPGYELVSPSKRFNLHLDNFEERVGYIAPGMKPKVIPAFTYNLPGNDKPVVTVSVDTLLVTHKNIPEAVVFEFTKTLLEQKPRFTAIAPRLFSGVNESFDPLDLSFPLHTGTRRYLDRNEPSLLERYAESINVLVYLAFLIITGLVALARWRAHRKKERIDVFYARVLAVQERIGGETPAVLLEELKQLEREAFVLLIDERLAANESFRIFTDLISGIRVELKSQQD
jgi:hypothetical protein